MANCLDVEVGVYHQFSNNLHAYLDNWRPEVWLTDYYADAFTEAPLTYGQGIFESIHLVRNKEIFDIEVQQFMSVSRPWETSWMEPFLGQVAAPMARAFQLHKQREYGDALDSLRDMPGAASDWFVEAKRWLKKRKDLHEARSN